MNFNNLLKLTGGTSNNIILRHFAVQQSLNNNLNNQLISNSVKYSSAIKEAERIVGYPTSFLSLRWILNDEIANIASHIRKLLGTNHPLLKIAKDLLLGNELPTWGLIVLLVSKTAGLNSNFTEVERDRTADVLHSQRMIAEVTEMIKTSNTIHKGLLPVDPAMERASDIHYGNKLALLAGDYLMSASFHEIARIGNHDVQEIMGSTYRDLAEADFIGVRNSTTNEAIPSKPAPEQLAVEIPSDAGVAPFRTAHVLGNMRAEWTLRNVLAGASLLGKSCQCALILAGQPAAVQQAGYLLGRNLALAWQIAIDVERFMRDGDRFSLVSAPVMFHLQHEPEMYRDIEKAIDDHGVVDYEEIRRRVLDFGFTMDEVAEFHRELSGNAMEALHDFSDSDSKMALVNIVRSMANLGR